jgi:hypothetical protein
MTSHLQKALDAIAMGAEDVVVGSYFDDVALDTGGICCLMAACSAPTSNARSLDFSFCCLNVEAVEAIVSCLSNCTLTELSLGNKDIGPRCAQALGEMLCVNMFLKLLYLYGCNVGDEGAGHLAVALTRNRTLEVLRLGHNGITHVGAAALAAVLPFNQALKRLDLDLNPLGDDGVEALAKAVPRSGLCNMWLFGTDFGEHGCAALGEMLRNGSRLQELQTNSVLWPALEEGFRCNGWLLDGAPEQYLERNKAMHLQARKSVYTLLSIRKLRMTALSSFPKDVVREIAQFVYSSRGEISVWQENKQ